MKLSDNEESWSSGRLAPVPPRRPQPGDVPGSEPAARPSGRPLEEGIDGELLEAPGKGVADGGDAGMSIARSAEMARVGRPAIYRRYKDKSELVRAALADKRARAATVDTGSARTDLIAYMGFAR